MAAFDHIILLLSFVYALAITHLLATTAALIRQSGQARFSWLHAFWMLNALLVIMANWIGFWDLRGLPSWNVATIFFTFGLAFVNYLQAALVCPEVKAGEAIDLGAFQQGQRLRIVGAFLTSGVLALIGNAVYGAVFGVITWGAENVAVVPMVVLAAAALVWPARWVQIAVAVLLMADWVFFFTVLQGALR